MKRKLFGYMLVLTLLILVAVVVGLVFSEGLYSLDDEIRESLEVQLDVFERDVESHFDSIASAGISLSEDISSKLEEHLNKSGLSFSDLKDSASEQAALQDSMIDLLCSRMFQEDCSGAFLMLDTTVNSSVENAERSKAGIYLQTNGYNTTNRSVILYRGNSDVAKNHDIMPHRKWRLEFCCDEIPEYGNILESVGDSAKVSYRFSRIVTLPGTSDDVLLLTVPVIGADGSFYGLCGFEISESFFMAKHPQPSKYAHITCMVVESGEGPLDLSAALSCGVVEGYHRIPTGSLEYKKEGSGLISFKDDSVSYMGLMKDISFSPNNEDHVLIVGMLRADYDLIMGKSFVKTVVLWLLLIFFAVNCCLIFSRRFLSPILKGIEELKASEHTGASTNVPEIDDLFLFLEEKDRARESLLADLSDEAERAKAERDRLRIEYEVAQDRFETARAEISRLAYSRKKEVDPDDYTRFLEGIKTLTPTEKKIFEYYLDGKTVREITEIASIKESTLRYHNQNIYGKLGVNSLKQLLRFAALMSGDTKTN